MGNGHGKGAGNPSAFDSTLAGHRHAQDELATPTSAGPVSRESARSGDEPPVLKGRTVGDYLFLEVIGSGGMGVIYAAMDTKLQRKVALKVLRSQSLSTSAYASSRLMREAQAMARLSHPNVVTIYQVGTIDDQVFVAMELIDGQTVRQWLKEQRPAWRQALDTMLQAGHGLQAAHAAGVTHRDFKPENVLIGKDGRVLVTDFGLARADSGPETQAMGEAIVDKSENLTMTGAIMGTPAYMAPEQHLGAPADARSDQYSYCLALYEAVYGQRPFACDSWDELAAAKEAAKVSAPPSGSRVPRWLRQILLHGLRSDPAKRFSTMSEILGAIERGRSRRRGVLLFASTGGVAITAGLVGVLVMSGGNDNAGVACTAGAERIASIWNDTVQERARTAFVATAQPFAQSSWAYASKRLDAYAVASQNMHRDACEATHVRGEQSTALLDRRMSCLARRAHELSAIIDLFVAPDAKIVAQAADAVNGLSRIEDCAPTEAMSVAATKRVGAADRAAMERRSAELARIKALASSARTDEALALAQRVAAEATAAGHLADEAEALLLEGRLQAAAGRFDVASNTLLRASEVAERAEDIPLRAHALVELVYVDGYELRRYAEAHVWARLARTILARVEGHDPLRARLSSNEGTVYFAEGNYQAARESHATALAIQRKTLDPNHIDLAVTTDRLASSLLKLGDHTEALAHHRAAVDLVVTTLGDTHIAAVDAVNNLGNALAETGDLEAAVVEYRRALKILEGSVGPRHARAAVGHANLGTIAFMRGDFTGALAEFETALEIEEASMGNAHAMVAETLTMIGTVHVERGGAKDAIPYLERALTIWLGMQNPPVDEARTRFVLARALWPDERRRALELAHGARARLASGGGGWQDSYKEVDGWLAERE